MPPNSKKANPAPAPPAPAGGGIWPFVASHAIEIYVACAVTLGGTWMVRQGMDLNREVGVVSEKMVGLQDSGSKIDSLTTSVAVLGEKVSNMSRDVDVLRTTQQITLRSMVQGGAFSADTRVADNPPTFHWNLQVPVEPSRVASITAEPLPAIPGVAVMALVDSDGKGCTMTLHGSAEAIANLPETIQAQVTISER